MSKDERGWNSSLKEKPVRSRPRRLVDWINLTGAKKVHSLIDKVYKRKNLEMAWEKVKENRGSGGVDGQSLAAFESQQGLQLARLEKELKEDTYRPQPVLQHPIPKRDRPGEYRMLGVPTIYDRVCQQALLNRLEPIFEPIFDDARFGYRRGRSTKDALRKIWKEIQSGSEWIVKLFNQLDRWIVRRIWSHRFKRWRNGGWTQLPTATLYGEYELVNLVGLIPSLASRSVASS
jgi:retron-type reverse transcriptase